MADPVLREEIPDDETEFESQCIVASLSKRVFDEVAELAPRL